MDKYQIEIDQLYRAIEMANNTIHWMLGIIIFLLLLYFVVDFFKRKELGYNLKKSKDLIEKLRKEEFEIDLVKPVLTELLSHIIYTAESSVNHYKYLGVDSHVTRMTLLNNYGLINDHLKLTYFDPEKNTTSLHQLIEVGSKDSLKFLELYDSILENNKKSPEYKDLKILIKKAIEKIIIREYENSNS